MIYLLYGYDNYLINLKLNELIKEHSIKNIIKYDFDTSSLIDIFNEVNYVDLFNDTKLLIVSNFSFKKLSKDDETLIIKYLDSNNDNVIIFKSLDETLDERKTITKKLRDKSKILNFPKLEYKPLEDMTQSLFKNNGYKIDYSLVKKIVNICANNSASVYNEIDKLMLYKMDDKVVLEEDIKNVVSKNYEKEIFTFLDSLMTNNKSSMLDSYKNLLDMNMDPNYILDRIANQFRMLYQVKILSINNNSFDIANILNSKPFVINKLLDHINSYKEEEIFSILNSLYKCDCYIKIDGMDRFKVLENLLLTI